MSFKLSSSIGRSAIRLVQEKDSIMSLSFACSSNGSFPGVVVQISVLCSVCFLGRWIRGEMGWGRRCRLRERMKRRFITPQPLIHENTKSTSATELGLIISSSPSLGGSERLQPLLLDRWRLPLHLSHTHALSTHAHIPRHTDMHFTLVHTPIYTQHPSKDSVIGKALSLRKMEGQES